MSWFIPAAKNADGGGGQRRISWLLTTEEGTQYKGHVTGGKAFNLPTKLPEGYHTLTLTQDDQRAHCRVIVAPKRCYEPQALLNKQKLWGACVQLYTLRSEKNWGIGDFGDLKAMLVDVAKRGGSFIGLNPIMRSIRQIRRVPAHTARLLAVG
ncbi:4-alpha-glucanotransferase [Escherichia coli]|uniref:4-alpha-glucanotransferase n=1 Tax=Escherichia coli TaxID=562 RepID=A0A377DAK7_ECOLX|nr:4-alpha-glucanotransferase [Escherichia coli]